MLTTSKLRTITENRVAPVHPGEILREEFLVPLGLNPHALATAMRVPATRMNEIVKERRSITADTALRLARYFNTTPELWMNLQKRFELDVARDAVEQEILRDVHPAPRDSKTGELLSRSAVSISAGA